MPPTARMSAIVASSISDRQSHRILPSDVCNSSARWPIANCGWVWISNSFGSSCRHALTWRAASAFGLVQAWPERGTYCRSSSQIGQDCDGAVVSGNDVPQVAQMWITVTLRVVSNDQWVTAPCDTG